MDTIGIKAVVDPFLKQRGSIGSRKTYPPPLAKGDRGGIFYRGTYDISLNVVVVVVGQGAPAFWGSLTAFLRLLAECVR